MVETTSPVTFRQLLRNRKFGALWLAQFVSNFGDWLAILALFSLVTFRLNGTPYQVSGVMISFIIPMALLGPIAGVFVDRWNVKATMITSDLLRAVLAAMLVLPTGLFQLYTLVFALSAVSCFFLPAQTVAILLLVRKEELLLANALNAQAIQFNKVISPAVAGVLVTWVGEKACFYIDGLTFVFSALMLSAIAMPVRASASNQDTKSIRKDFSDGLRFIANHRAIFFVIISIVAAIFALGAFDALIAVYVRDILSANSRLFGTIVSLVGVGTILGSLVIGRFGQRQSKVHMVILGILGLGISVLIIATFSRTDVMLLCSVLFGITVAYVLIPSQTLLQEETPQSILGRVSAASISLMTISQLASFLIAGAIAELIGIRGLYYVVAMILILTACFGYVYVRVKPMPSLKEVTLEVDEQQ